MKKLLSAIVLATASSSLLATPIYHPSGSNIVYGSASQGKNIMSAINNPAAGVTTITDGDTVQLGIFSSIGVGAEYGEVDNLFQEIDDQVNNFYDTANTINITNPNDVNATITEIDTSIQSLNSLMTKIEKDGYGKAFASVHLPVMPVVVSHSVLGGALVLDMNASVTSKGELLHEDIYFNTNQLDDPNDDIVYNLGDTTFTVDNDTTLLVRGAVTYELSLAYSRDVWATTSGHLYAGVRGKYYKVGLTKLNQRLSDLQNNSETVFDNIGDDDYKESSNIGIDAGVLWISNKYRLGASVVNINQPTFKYNGLETANYDVNGVVYQKLLDLQDFTMAAQLQLEASFNPIIKNWVSGVTLDANAVEDPFGDEYQWATLSTAYIPDYWLIPSVRVGYRGNLAGSKLNYITGGVTLFKVNIDVAYGLEDVQIDNQTYPRSFMLNIGLDLAF